MIPRITILLAGLMLSFSIIAQEEQVFDIPTTEIQFEEMEYDFGDILQGTENPHVFKFKNTGDTPLLITKAKGSCGCTVPFFAPEPIMPGEESEIHVVYKPGKQKYKQNKTVTITANTTPSTTVIRIQANVLESDLPVDPSIFAIDEQHQKDRDAIDIINPGCFVIFPNPTTSELHLDLKQHIGRSADIHIHSDSGKDMLQTRIDDISNETSRLDVSDFTAGIYIISIQVDGQKPMSQCFVVDK